MLSDATEKNYKERQDELMNYIKKNGIDKVQEELYVKILDMINDAMHERPRLVVANVAKNVLSGAIGYYARSVFEKNNLKEQIYFVRKVSDQTEMILHNVYLNESEKKSA